MIVWMIILTIAVIWCCWNIGQIWETLKYIIDYLNSKKD